MKQKISVAVDARVLNTAHLRGMGKYLYHLIASSTDIHWTVFGDCPKDPIIIPKVSSIRSRYFGFGGSRYQTWEQVGLPIQLRADRSLQLLHCPANSAPLIQPKPTVVTIHDTFPWDKPSEGPLGFAYRNLLLPKAFESCKAIITGSAQSAGDIANHWPRLADKISIIPHGVDPAYLVAELPGLSRETLELGVHPPYLLYLGATLPRKRFRFAAEILTALNIPGLSLVACGMNSQWISATKEELESLSPRPIVPLPFVTETQMLELYANAEAVLYPTLKEGFGFPLLESQAVGTPVLCSKEGSVSELLGPGAIPLEAEDFTEWVRVCRDLIEARSRRRLPNESARQWARSFSWAVTADKTIAVYQRALDS